MYFIVSLVTSFYFVATAIFLLPNSYFWTIFIILIISQSIVYGMFRQFFRQYLNPLSIESTVGFIGSNIGALLMYLLVFNAYSPISANLRWLLVICASFLGQLIAKRLLRHHNEHHYKNKHNTP